MFRPTPHQFSSGNSGSRMVAPFVAFVMGVVLTMFVMQGSLPATSSPATASEQKKLDLALFWQVWDILQSDALDAEHIDPLDASYGATTGLVDSLADPHTSFFTPEATKAYGDSLEGTLEGIGAELIKREGNLTIEKILKSSPAQRAGLLPKDIIYEIDETFSSDVTLWDAVSLIRGPAGTTVTLKVIRDGVEEPLEFVITRDAIHIESVSLEDRGDGIFLITLSQFGDVTTDEFRAAVSTVEMQRPRGVILDLRYNPGGYMQGAVDVVSEFMTTGDVVKIVERSGEEMVSVHGEPQLPDVPLVVLVDEGSASASEIVAGALQDYGRATIVGTQTYGKGTVQELRELPDGSTLKMTVARWYTPLGRDVDQVGIRPDEIVEFTDEDFEKEFDRQLERAIEILRGETVALSGEQR